MKECMRRPVWERYAVAVGAVAAMATLRWMAQPFAGTYSPMSMFYFAVIASAWWGGLGPGLLAIALSVLAVDILFLGNPWTFNLFESGRWLTVVVFILVNVLVTVMIEALHRARRNADARALEIREKHEALDREVSGREQAEAQLRNIVESVHDFAIIALDANGHIVRWNAGASRIFGYSPKEVHGQHFSLIFTPEDRTAEIPKRELKDAAEYGFGQDERWHLRKDGIRIFGSGSISPIRDDTGKITGFTKVLRDATARRKGLRALRASEENFRVVFETAAAGVVQVDPTTGAFLRVNHCFRKITGYSEAELKGMTFLQLTFVEDRTRDFAAFQRMVRGETDNYESEKRYVRKDGRVIWVHVNGGLVRDEDGRPQYAVGVIQDITERRQAELALAEAEERFRLAAEISELGTWATNPETQLGNWSPRMREIFGLSKDIEARDEIAWARIHPEDRPELKRKVIAASDPAGPGYFVSEHRIVRPDNTVRWVQTRGLFLFAGEGAARHPIRGVGAILDITERREAIERMHRREEAIVALATTRPTNLEERIHQVTEAASNTLDVERVGVWLYTPDRSGIQCEDLYRRSQHTHERGSCLTASQYPKYFAALAWGAPIAAEDAQTHTATAEFREGYLKPLGICSMLDVPIWVGGRLAGVICHEHMGERRQWSTDDQEFAASLATTVALALEADQRRQAEEALAARERQLRQVGDNLPEGVLYQILVFPDGHTQFLYFSAGLEQQTGITAKEALQDANILWGLIVPESLPMVQRAQARAIKSMTPINLTIPFRNRQTGELRWIQLRASPEQASNGAVLFNGVAVDVTAQRQTEAALAEAEERLRLAAKAAGMGTFDRNFEALTNHWSPEMNAIFGLPANSEVPFERMARLVHSDDRKRVASEIERALAPDGQGCFESVYRVLRPDGTIRWVRVNGQTFFVGEGEGRRAARILGAAVDITALKEAEEAAHESSERFRTLADNMSQLAWMADEKGWIFWCNRRSIDFTGARLEDIQGWKWQRFVHPAHAERVVAKLRHHIETGEVWEDTFPVRNRNGTYRWFLSRSVPIRDEQGKVLRWFGTNTDITEQRKGEEELREADRRKSEFLAMLGHELRNPLAAIRNALVLCQEDMESFEWAKGVVDRQSTQLARLVDDLLDVSRITRGKVVLRRERVEVCTAVSRAVESARPLIVQRGHELSVECPDCDLWVDADPGRLEQIIGNLLTNAAKYTEPGGKISVMVSSSCRVEQPEMGDRDKTEWPFDISITVSDTGVGIPPEKLPQMFEIFTQAERSLDRAEGGLGLGLAIVKMLTEMHGGRVYAWSPGLGKGSTFSIHLPAAPSPPTGEIAKGAAPGLAGTLPSTAVSSPSLPPNRQRVLVVDDNVDAAQALGKLLSRFGCELEIAVDGPAALKRAHDFHPTAVLLDIGLPGMDGYEVARRIRADEHEDHALLVAVTGYGQEEDVRRSREAGFDRHLVKPVDIEEIRRLLESGSIAK